jgi:hypothetical protein
MSMLGTKCGWLAKRNEQRVWQKRWCVVVPHTFLYYFEASPANTKDAAQQEQQEYNENSDDNDNNMHTYEVWNGGGINTNNANNLFLNLDQDALNNAVKDMSGGGGGNNNNGNGGGGMGIAGGEENNMVTWDPEQHYYTSNSPTTTTQTLASIGHHPQYDGIGGPTNNVKRQSTDRST